MKYTPNFWRCTGPKSKMLPVYNYLKMRVAKHVMFLDGL